ncbi:MAG: hypothetical protein DHS20C21_01880 [Gemmatimonadota bacterium]|nr:MAG: hypothetical protein DHS20C21_01880 [Gemmatimonadota bacterium]
MTTAHDVAAYILDELGPVSAMKLQKLVYYSQAWHLVWEDGMLFEDEIQAWTHGPVIPALFKSHSGKFQLQAGDIDGDAAALSTRQQKVVDQVLEFYGDKSSQWLSDLTHFEAPWKGARRGISDAARASVEITPESMMEYYSSLAPIN